MFAGVAQWLERRPVTAEAAGSSPVFRANKLPVMYRAKWCAAIAQSVEHSTENARVAGSSPACGTILFPLILGAILLSSLARADRPLGPGDAVIFTSESNPMLCVQRTVSERGLISLPGCGQVFLTGLSITLAQAKVEQVIAASGTSESSDIQLRRVRNAHQSIFIEGRVKQPIRLRPRTGLTLGEVLAIAGPLNIADLEAITIQDFNGAETVVSAQTQGSTEIYSGDRVIVPAMTVSQTIIVVGGVSKPGSIAFRPNMKVIDAVIASGGIKPGPFDWYLQRHGKPEQKLDLVNDRNFILQPGDILSIRLPALKALMNKSLPDNLAW